MESMGNKGETMRSSHNLPVVVLLFVFACVLPSCSNYTTYDWLYYLHITRILDEDQGIDRVEIRVEPYKPR